MCMILLHPKNPKKQAMDEKKRVKHQYVLLGGIKFYTGPPDGYVDAVLNGGTKIYTGSPDGYPDAVMNELAQQKCEQKRSAVEDELVLRCVLILITLFLLLCLWLYLK